MFAVSDASFFFFLICNTMIQITTTCNTLELAQ